MGLEFPASISDRRFPLGLDHAKSMFVMASIINPDSAPNENCEADVPNSAARPRAATWLWHPWYAKLWWAGIALYWSGMAATFALPALDAYYSSPLAGLLNILFFPLLALIILGLGFARAWFAWSDWEFVEPSHEQMFPKRSVGGMRDPASDPLDPRSGALHRRHFHRGR